MGYLTGRIDVADPHCGQSKLIPVTELDSLFKLVRTDRGALSAVRRPVTPGAAVPAAPAATAVAGKAFLVYFLAPEVLE
ncbi:MAG: hypothetical protein NTV86_16250 [Planctomycetota bacterium]|nr:hypothetical protein [Planctomycetota bacterium]